MNDLPQMREKRAVLSLALIFAFRMLGLFMIIPVFSLYADELRHADKFLIGLAFGIYGLTQALLQIPFGILSDRFGRKPIIAIGLILFAIGSLVAAGAQDIYMMILGRGLQGMGAVGSTLIAFVADLTKEQNRTKAMAVVGMVIGLSFSVAMVLGSLLNTCVGVPGIFLTTAGLALFGIVILYTIVPNPVKCVLHQDQQSVPRLFKSVLTNTQLLRLDFGIFCQHAILTASFVVIPLLLEPYELRLWMVYLPIMVCAFLLMVPLIVIAEKKQQLKPVFLIAIVLCAISQAGLYTAHQSLIWIIAMLGVFFIAFNTLEALLPSLISKAAPAGSKGTAMGVYSSSQFLGIFVGGTLGGYLYHHFSLHTVFLGSALLAIAWAILALSMRKPKPLSSILLPIPNIDTGKARELAKRLLSLSGVHDVAISAKEQVAFVKIDKRVITQESLIDYLHQQST